MDAVCCREYDGSRTDAPTGSGTSGAAETTQGTSTVTNLTFERSYFYRWIE